jgi:uncharacterized protein YbjQ (UPF0145 family)
VSASPGPGAAPADLAIEALRRRPGSGRAPVTLLSVDEAVLLDQVGFEPLGLVSGASVVHLAALARLGAGFSSNTEMTELSAALGTSRTRAVQRLTEAGRAAGADGVVGVSVDVGDLGAGSRLVHLVVSGTAVRSAGYDERFPGRRGGPAGAPSGCFTAALRGQDVHLLARAGYRPLGIVSGVCVYHVGRRGFSDWAGGITENQEMTVYTEALYEARELAMTRLQDDAVALGADGVVGVTVTERTGVWGSHVIEFAAIGTAVVLVEGTHRPLDPKLVIDLAGPA